MLRAGHAARTHLRDSRCVTAPSPKPGAGGEIRTRTRSPSADFKSAASALPPLRRSQRTVRWLDNRPGCTNGNGEGRTEALRWLRLGMAGRCVTRQSHGVPMSSAAPNPRWARRLATILAATTILMSVAALILLIPNTAVPAFIPLGFFGAAAFVLGVGYAAVGWLIVSRSPANRIGWLLLLVGLPQTLSAFTSQYAFFGLLGHPGALPLADIAAWIYFWGYFPGLLLFFPTLLVFPDGHLPSGRWRLVLWAVGVAAILI